MKKNNKAQIPDTLLHNTNASQWADEFIKQVKKNKNMATNKEIIEYWFGNSLTAGYTTGFCVGFKEGYEEGVEDYKTIIENSHCKFIKKIREIIKNIRRK